jgi:WD40 repeat protein/serine/threonine protein kinase
MPITSAVGLFEAVRRFALLSPAQTDEVAGMHGRFADARAVAKELLQRGWLTPYQINHLVAGNGYSLVLGQYVLLERIGEGGMGQVLKARHQRLERIVALKLIRKERLAGRDAVQRFQREARAAARLAHPNLVTVYDADEVGGTHFFAMEYVEGTDLAKLVRQQGPLPVREASEYVRQAALGLQHAHEQGLVHRDIKPANLMLTTKGVVKVLDLGLARLATAAESGDPTDPMTQEGTVMGTPDYMAPEQATDSRSADIRADLYSLGCTLFYVLIGKVPFPGGTLAEKLVKHQIDPPPRVDKVRPEVPTELGAVVLRLMAKKPAERYARPSELATALEPFTGTRPPVAIPLGATVTSSPEAESHQNTETEALTVGGPKPMAVPVATVALRVKLARWKVNLKERRRLLAIGGGLLALLIALFIAVGPRKPSQAVEQTHDPKRAEWPLDNLTPGAFQSLREFDDWPPNGLVLVLGSHRGRHWGPVRAVAYSPDGKLVASGGDDARICVWKAEDLAEYRVLLGHQKAVNCLVFSADSTKLLSGGEDKTVRLWDVVSGKEQLKLVGHTDTVASVAMSPAGELALSGATGGIDHAVRRWDITHAGKQLQPLEGHTAAIRCVTFSKDGRRAFSGSADRTLRTWDLSTGKQTGQLDLPRTTGMIAVSPEGRIACDREGGGGMDLWQLATGQSVGARGVDLFPFCLAYSPAGHRVALGTGFNGLGIVQIWDDTTPETLRIFKGFMGPITALAFSADGRRLTGGGPDGVVRIWDIDDDVEIAPRPGHVYPVNTVAVSIDGRYLLSGGLDHHLHRWDLASDPPGREVQRLEGHGGPITAVVIRPDGKQAMSSSGDGTVRLWDLEALREIGRCEISALDIAFTDEGLRAVGGRQGSAYAVWDIAECGKPVGQFDPKGLPDYWMRPAAAAISPDGRRAFLAHMNGVVSLWDVSAIKMLASFETHPAREVTAVAFSPDGQSALSGSADGSVRLWDVKSDTLSEPTALLGHTGSIASLAFAPGGQAAAASSKDGKVIVWDLKDLKKPRQQWQLPAAVNGVTFDAKGRHLATANANGTIFILRLPE